MGIKVITGGLRFGEGPFSGSVTIFKSLQGSLQAEGIVLSCVALEGRDITKGYREANRNKLLVQEARAPSLKVCKEAGELERVQRACTRRVRPG